MINNYIINLTVLSPVFIGSGEEISKKDCLYLTNERKVYIMDSMKMFNGIKKLGLLNKYEEYLLDSSQKNFFVFSKENSIVLNEVKSWASYVLPMNNITELYSSRKTGGGSDNILSFIKDKFGCPYIPGSSLKGAIRTVIQNAECMSQNEKFENVRRQIENEHYFNKKKYLYDPSKQISTDLFNTLNRKEEKKNDVVNDSFAGLRISDSLPLDTSSLILCQKIDRHTDGKDTLLPIKRECLKPGTKVQFQLEIDNEMMNITPKTIMNYASLVFNDYSNTFLSKFSDTNIAFTEATVPLIIGGGTGFATKTSVYPLYKNKSAAIRTVQRILINTTATKKSKDPHKHSDDTIKYHISPHIRKCTKYNGKIYDMGLCDIDIVPVK